jgi:two-component system, chemotaxis family, protein-glutamate methylesterase/glutaminase
MSRRLRVLIVDDSLFMRAAIKKIVESDPRLEVAGMAKDGAEAVDLAAALAPDVITMDFNMPRMDGASAVRAIMQKRPTPVVMLSAHTKEGARETFEALSAGAVDFLTKPGGEVSADFHRIGPALIERIMTASSSVPRTFTAPQTTGKRASGRFATWPPTGPRVAVIGVSTGGPSALSQVIPALPGTMPFALIIVQHMPAQFTATLAERLNSMSEIDVREARDGDRPRQGMALVAPGDKQLEVADGGVLRITDGPEVNGCRPSVDVTMKGAARVFGRRAIGLIMTGMGKDGAEGMQAIKEAGGRTLAQDKDTCVIYGMPRAAVELGCVDEIVSLGEIPDKLQRI